MDSNYWKNRYKNEHFPSSPSKFAEWAIEFAYIQPGDRVLELGCGNGRDSIWFATHGVNVFACDQAKCKIDFCPGLPVKFDFDLDFANYDQMMERYGHLKFDQIYSRFTWHAISEQDENEVLFWSLELLKVGGQLLIECRSIYDYLFGEGKEISKNTFVYNGHTRRFINPGDLINKLFEYGYDTMLTDCQCGLAPYEEEDPKVLRIFATKVR